MKKKKNVYKRRNVSYSEGGWSVLSGWGVYDSEEPYKWRIEKEGREVTVFCPFFKVWDSLLKRCVKKRGSAAVSYKNCTICEEWKYFSNFKRWVSSQPNEDWRECELDKDLLVLGNTLYSPDTCCFITKKMNGFLKFIVAKRGKCMIGVSYKPSNRYRPYQADCSNPFNKRKEYLGSFSTEMEAHLTWKRKKHSHALLFSEETADPRVSAALTHRYSENVDWSCT